MFKDTTEPSLLKNLLSSTVKKEPMNTPFNQRNTAENVQTKQPLVATVLEGNDPLKAELPFKRSEHLSSYLFYMPINIKI